MRFVTTGAAWVLAVGLWSGCASDTPRGFKPLSARFFLEAGNDQGTPITLPQSGVTVVANSKPVFTEGDIINVDLVKVDLGQCLVFQLTPTAARDFYRMSVTHNGRRVVLMVNDKPLGARRLDGAVTNGALFLFVEIPDEDLPALVENLKQSARAMQRELARK